MRPAQALYFAGDQSLLDLPCVAVVGSREASELGIARARRLARELAEAGVVVVSGLARGVDAAAHREAITCGGRTIAVVGTPLERCYPAAHANLQAKIAADHLVVSPFAPGSPMHQRNFPIRNRVMAALCDATVIVEAGEKSGTRHQAEECRRLGRELFLCSSLVANMAVAWPLRLIGPGTHVLVQTLLTVSTIRRNPERASIGPRLLS